MRDQILQQNEVSSIRSSWLTIIAIILAAFMVNLDTSIVNIILPTLTKIFEVNADEVVKIVLWYLLAIVSSLLIFGKLSDIYGKKKVFICGYILFTMGSLFCGLAFNLLSLSSARILQGLGGAMLFATIFALVIENFSAQITGRVFALITMSSSCGVVLGSPLGGFILKHLSWQWIFYINVLPGITGTILALKTFKRDDFRSTKKNANNFDYVGMILSIVSILTLFSIISSYNKLNWFSFSSLLRDFIFIIFFIAFVWWERKHANPLIDLKLLRSPLLSTGILGLFVVTMTLNGTLFILPFFFEKVFNFQPVNVGLFLSIIPLTIFLLSPIAGWLADRFNTSIIMIFALLFLIISFGLFYLFTFSFSFYLIIFVFVLFGTTLAFFFTTNMKFIMSKAPARKEGILSAINSLSVFLAAGIGIAIFETIFSLGFKGIKSFVLVPMQLVVKGFNDANLLNIILVSIAFAYSFFVIFRYNK
ncbi:MAG: hypothetical protein AMJ43_03590 [Coxiella sp. DG_40]|nr:MAG: hypothetical protein AMJ43_03590 [Coxiella sp. DG_40]